MTDATDLLTQIAQWAAEAKARSGSQYVDDRQDWIRAACDQLAAFAAGVPNIIERRSGRDRRNANQIDGEHPMRRLSGARRRSSIDDSSIGALATVVQITSVVPASLIPPGTYQASAVARNSRSGDTDATGTAAITWSSSNTSVFTVNASTGLVTSVGSGTASLIASYAGMSDSQDIVVVAAPSSPSAVLVSPATVDLIVGGATQTIQAIVVDASNNALVGETVTWDSNDTGVVTVSADSGDPSHLTTATAVGAGTATITATSGVLTDTCAATVTVSQGSPTPFYENDFSQYASTAELIADAANYNQPQLGKKFILSEDQNPGDITWRNDTNPVTGVPGVMRYTYRKGACSDYTIRRQAFFPGALTYPEIWIEIYEAFSTTFETDTFTLLGCSSPRNPDLKHLIVNVNPNQGRLGVSWNGSNHDTEIYFASGSGTGTTQEHTKTGPAGARWSDAIDGNSHRYRYHMKVNASDGSNTGVLAMMFDNITVWNFTTVDAPRTNISAIGSANLNMGPDATHVGMYREFYRWRIWNIDPGWGI